ncbi:MAG: LamG-like jellyroll fold domain-containing protein [Verrucomicrobiota bacterium]|nr:hypothetical protein [Limisphaera sp.]MDW8382477.1 LamG-like jellyroll fold domain-containing protein [Verrucomicrobiota bacterium]
MRGETWEHVGGGGLKWELREGRAEAVGTRHGVRVGRLGHPEGAVQWRVGPNRQVRARPVAVVLWEEALRQSVVIGQVLDRVGLGLSDGLVVYTNALEGLPGRVRLRVGPNWVEQDLLLEGWLESLPAGWKLDQVWLEVWTEWWGEEGRVVDEVPLEWSAQGAGRWEGIDAVVELGGWRLVSGRAFGWPQEETAGWVPVAKQWIQGPGDRQYLVERVPLGAVRNRLERLPRWRLGPGMVVRSGRWEPGHDSLSWKGGVDLGVVAVSGAWKEHGEALVMDWLLVGPVPMPAGCVAWWPLAGDGREVVNGLTSSTQGSIGWGAGAVGRGLILSGAGGLTVADAGPLNGTTGLTLEGWVYWIGGETRPLPVVAKDGPGQQQYSLVVWSNRIEGGVELTGPGWVRIAYAGALTPERWHHVALTWDSERLRLYVNGREQTNRAAVGTLRATTQPVTLGAIPQYGWWGVGRLDEVAIYGRALSASELWGIYQAAGAGKVWPSCGEPPAGLVTWWPVDAWPWDLARTNALRLRNGLGFGPAVVGGGLEYDGADDGADAGPASLWDVAVGEAFSVELWVRPEFNITDFGVMSLVGKRWASDVGSALGWEVFLLDGRLGVQLADAGGFANFISSGPDLRDGGWHHVVWVLDRQASDGGRLYVDGLERLRFNPQVRPGSLTNGEPVRVGVHPQEGFRGFYKGGLDEIRLYRRALAAVEVDALYRLGPAGLCKRDSDRDGLADLQETFLGTNPINSDSDGDGVEDGVEVAQGRNPGVAGAIVDAIHVHLRVDRPW